MTLLSALWMPAALAAEPARPSPPEHVPVAVEEVRWAQPFTLAEPTMWTMGRDRRPVDSGWLVELRAAPELLTPRAVGQAVLFADGVPVRALHTPLVASCSVVAVPADRLEADEKLSSVRWYFGSTELPERMDEVHGAWELQVAVDAGVMPQAPTVLAPPVALDRFEDLAAQAQGRFERCRAELSRPQDEPNTF